MKRAIVLLCLLLLNLSTALAEEHPQCWVEDINDDYIPTEEEIFSEYGSFTYLNCCSFDGRFIALQSVEKRESDQSEYVYVYIADAESSEVRYVFRAERAFDFWGICWDRDSYDLWLQSADVGIYVMRYADGSWTRNFEAQQPDWLVTRWNVNDMQRRCKNLIGKPLDGLNEEYPDILSTFNHGCLKCENGYIWFEMEWFEMEETGPQTITAAAGFNHSGVLLYNEGVDMLSSEQFDSCSPTTVGELYEAFGCGYGTNRGLWSTSYLVDDGRVVWYFGIGANEDFYNWKIEITFVNRLTDWDKLRTGEPDQ